MLARFSYSANFKDWLVFELLAMQSRIIYFALFR